MRQAVLIVAGALALGLGLMSVAEAQQAGLSQGRDCQTVRTCNFARGGTFRGCLSSYTCRTCRLQAATRNCNLPGGRCQEMVCRWGG
jgi:hypothetical protein